MAFTLKQDDYILTLFELSNKSPNTAVNLYIQKFGVPAPSESTFRKKWKSAGFNLQNAGGVRYGLSRTEFIKLYNKCRGNLELIMEKSKFKYKDIKTLKNICSKYNLLL